MAKSRESKKMGILYRVTVLGSVMLFVMYFLNIAWLHKASAAPVPLDQQKILAIEYRFAISRTTDASEREALYLRMIAECPDTELAEEAHWALSNIYLDDFDEPKEGKSREILELFLKRYPSSRWVPHVESRLQWLRGEARAVP